MEVLYVLEPRRTSGARYHRVTTFVRHESAIMWRENHITRLVRECVHGYTEGPGQAKISKFELSFPIDEQVLWL
jgi:hypothetical protein